MIGSEGKASLSRPAGGGPPGDGSHSAWLPGEDVASTKSQRILLGVCGGIAAYKSAETIRLLLRYGFAVTPLLTRWGSRFIGELTLAALAGEPCLRDEDIDGSMLHIQAASRADLMLLAPLTADSAARLAGGRADDLLSQCYLAFQGQTLACPAMNTTMLHHPAVQRNLEQLTRDGVRMLSGEPGPLACGTSGEGRMAEPARIVGEVQAMLTPKLAGLVGARVLVTAGPTREAIDPVRFLSNRSSGRMGVALATALSHAGAEVTLVHGPMEVPPPPFSTNIAVESAAAMAEAVLSRAASFDIFVLCAAVADFTVQPASQKLKKDRFNGILQLEPTLDILATLGARRQSRQLLVGFAAESEDALENARNKLLRKGADLLLVNQVGGPDCPFSSEKSRLTCLDARGSCRDLGLATKMHHAQTIATLLHQRRTGTT